MRPALSVIFFTTASGAGYGMLIVLGLLALRGELPEDSFTALGMLLPTFALIGLGLVSSTFHLGHPERALKAFSQWRSSWLSREGWAAVLALIVMAIYGAGLVFFGVAWAAPGVIGAALSLGTVFTTSMIYAQLKTVPRWHTVLTPVMFLSISLAGGALLADQLGWALWLLVLTGAVQVAYWVIGDRACGRSASQNAITSSNRSVGSLAKARLITFSSSSALISSPRNASRSNRIR